MPARRRTGSRAYDGTQSVAGADERIAVGIIRKPHGVRGEASVEPWTDSPDRFAELQDVLLVSPDESETRPSRIESTRTHAGRALVKFDGIDSPEDLQAVRNWTIEIPRADSRPLERDEYFLHDLVGLSAEDPAGLAIGSIVDAYEGGGGILLTLETPEGGTFDVPFATAICTEIDLAGKRMVMVLPEGLDDLAGVPAVEEAPRGARKARALQGAPKRDGAE